MRNSRETRQHVVKTIYSVVKMLTGKSWWYQDDPRIYQLTADLIKYNLFPVSGYIKYVYDVKILKFNYVSLFDSTLPYIYYVYRTEQAAHIRARIELELKTFDIKRQYIPITELLSTPRHDLTILVQWCLAKRHFISLEHNTDFDDSAVFELRCNPWYNKHIDLLPELQLLKTKPYSWIAEKYKHTGRVIKVKNKKKGSEG